jgi:hypothetical protein
VPKNWTEVFGENHSYCGPSSAGIPEKEKIWEFVPASKKLSPEFFSIVVYENILYFMGVENYVAALNTDIGKLIWEVFHPAENAIRTVVNANYLVIEPCVMDRKTGALLYNYGDIDVISDRDEESELLLSIDYPGFNSLVQQMG